MQWQYVREAPEDYSGCVVKTFVGYPGNDLTNMPLEGVTSLSACADACRSSSNGVVKGGNGNNGGAPCRAFSFTAWRECFLKAKMDMEEDSFGGSISGTCT